MSDAPIDQPTAEPAAPPAAEPAAPPVGSLLDAAAAPAPVADPAAPEGEAPAAEEKILGKFKSVDDLKKSYQELEKKLGSFIGAPEEYELSMPEGVADLSTDDLGFDDRLSAVREAAKELNMSQDGFTKLVHAFIAADQQMNTVHVERELAALGPDAPARISDVSTFYAKAFGEDDFMTVREIARTADGVQFLERAMQKMRNTSTIPATVTAATATQSEQQWRDSVDWKRYESDRTYRESRLADLRRIVGS